MFVYSLVEQLLNTARKPGLWLIIVLFLLITIPHYNEALHPPLVNRLFDSLDLDRQAFERILYLLPIIGAGFLFGPRGAYIASITALGCLIPRAVLISPSIGDALFESGAIFFVGIVIGFAFASLQKERKRRMQLDALTETALIVSQSLELEPILNSSIDSVTKVMKVDVAQVFLVDEGAGELVLATYRGMSRRIAEDVTRLKIGEGLNGLVAQTGEPHYVENASTDPRLTRAVLKEDNIGSMLIVPLKSKERVMGTLCVGMRSRRQFSQDELELLMGIGNQIGIAVENARLYQRQREFAEQLLSSEQRYRELFEHAHDAIWLHDLNHNIIAANRSCTRLTGYSIEELQNMKAYDLIRDTSIVDSSDRVSEINQTADDGQLLETKLHRKDGAEAWVQLSTNPIFTDGRPVAFQYIARDITEEKRMRENERFYLRQVTIAQEEERKRIARELHDDTVQELIVLSRELDELGSKAKGLSTEEKARIDNLWQQTNNIVSGVRRLSQDLRPATLDRLGLLTSVEWLASNTKEYSGIDVEVSSYGEQQRLDPEVELVLFRIVQEALSNIWRHSKATAAWIAIDFKDDKIVTTIRDNGQGFSVPSGIGDLAKEGKLGLAGMKERAKLIHGSVAVESESGKGTIVAVEVPV